MFLIRIELHHETNYNPLYEAMSALGFKRLINADDGRIYKLPTGLYYRGNSGTAEGVRKLAHQAAVIAGHLDAMIVVADAKSLAWSGLDEASALDQLWMVGA